MSGWQIKYKELFSLSIEQLFYTNGLYNGNQSTPIPDLQVVPTPECISFMKRRDFLFRTVPGQAGFIVLSNVRSNSMGDDVLRFPVKNTDKLSFWMILKNTDLLSFDDLPVRNDPGRIYYFNNNLSDAGALRNNLHISVGVSGVNSTTDSIKKSGSDYLFHHNAVVNADTAFVRHIITGLQLAPKTIINQLGESDLYFDLSSIPSGKCKLMINASEKDSFYYLGSLPSQPIFGIIEISLSTLLEANYRVVEPADILSPARPLYKIRFNNRKTLWRYSINLEKNNPLYVSMQTMTPAERTDFISHIKITTNDNGITFSQVAANDTVFEFVSDAPISLQEKYFSSTLTAKVLCLTLKKNTGIAGEAVVKDYLPFPSTGSVNALSDPLIYSDIFLTL